MSPLRVSGWKRGWKMSKFKVGDVVRYKTNFGPATGYFVRDGGRDEVVVSDERNGGKEHKIPEHWILNSCVTSTNPVVQNALKAKNARWAMISREGGKWYYAWADGSSNGTEGPFRSEDEATIAAKQDGFKIKNSSVAANAEVVKNARTDWNQEVYNITEKVKKLIAKAKAEGATGPNSFGEIFENCLKVLRGY